MKYIKPRSVGFIFAIVVAIATSMSVKAATPEVLYVNVVGHGQPMILIPGLASDGSVWQSTVEHYSSHYECHVLTLAGFAGKPAIQGDLLDQAEDAVSLYIAQHHLKNPVIVGHSLGGFLGMRLASHHPDQVGRLIVVDSLPALGATTIPNATPEQLRMVAARMRDGVLAGDPASRAANAKQVAQSMVTAPADVDRVQAWSVASDKETMAQAMYDIVSTDLRPSLPKIKANTLVLGTWIAYKDYAPRTAIEATYKQQYEGLPQLTFAMADTARHFIMLDDPNWMFTQIDTFLQ